MNKALVALCCAALLSACSSTDKKIEPIRTKYELVQIDDSLLDCKEIELPNPETMTKYDLDLLLNNLIAENRKCTTNVEAIKAFQKAARSIIDQRNKEILDN